MNNDYCKTAQMSKENVSQIVNIENGITVFNKDNFEADLLKGLPDFNAAELEADLLKGLPTFEDFEKQFPPDQREQSLFEMLVQESKKNGFEIGGKIKIGGKEYFLKNHGLYEQLPTEPEPGPVIPAKVEICVEWLQRFGKFRTKISKKDHSYTLKKCVQRWLERSGREVPGGGNYISNGDFIAACLLYGFQAKIQADICTRVTDLLNVYFNISRPCTSKRYEAGFPGIEPPKPRRKSYRKPGKFAWR